MNVRRAVLVVFLGLLIGACGGGSANQQTGGGGGTSSGSDGTVDQNPVFQTGDRVASAHMGAPGGTLSLGNRDYEKPVGPTLHLQPGINLSGGSVTVSIPATSIPGGFTEDNLTLAVEIPGEVQRSSVMGSTQTTWTYLPAHSANGRFTADLSDVVPGMRLQFLVSEE
jgi:hypothetical protein